MEPQKISSTVFDPVSENLKNLVALFPSVIKDGKVDFKALKAELGEFEEVGKERYELTWAGKQQAKKVAAEGVSGRTLKYVPEESKCPESTENLYIEGDNLEVLKLLQNSYMGKIKMIYIDPPYNTGNDFIYCDKFSTTESESAKAEGDMSLEGERYTINTKSSGKYHAKWLSMMYPRLRLAKNLLKDDGVIFVSIDDNEVSNLWKIMDEIYGEENFVALFPRVTKKAGKSADDAAKNNDFILCYYNSFESELNSYFHTDRNFKYSDEYEDIRGKYKLNQTLDYSSIQYSPSLDYEIEIDGIILRPGNVSKEEMIERKKKNPKSDFCWRWSRDLFEFGFDKGFVVLKKSNNGYRIYTKTYQNVTIEKNNGSYCIKEKERTKTASTLDFIDNKFSNDNSRKDIGKMFEEKIFEYSKPVSLLKTLSFLSTSSDDIILDFFSGSATTAHAVMQLNSEDEGKRKFIMVQLPEECPPNSEAAIAGYKTISDIGKERIRRAGEKIKRESGDNAENLDIGFKVFKTSDTNIRWIAEENGMDISQTHLDNSLLSSKDRRDFMPDATDIDVAYEILLRQYDIPLSTKMENLSDIGQRTYIFANVVVVCLEEEISKEIIDKIAAIEPMPHKIIFRDTAFGKDISLKLNTMERFNAMMKKHSDTTKQPYVVEFL